MPSTFLDKLADLVEQLSRAAELRTIRPGALTIMAKCENEVKMKLDLSVVFTF